MHPSSRIYVAGHRGLIGSALERRLRSAGYDNLVLRTHAELDLLDQTAVRRFFQAQRLEYVFLAAAKVGGIFANHAFPAEFITENLRIQTNVVHEARQAGVKRLLFLGSSCIYPKFAPQPLKESYLLTGPLEPTNRSYALAKIAGIEMCWSYNRQYGTRFLAAMPTSLYGPGDHYHPENSHVVPALIRKMHEAKLAQEKEVVVWGTGEARREFLFSDDAADACVFLMGLADERFHALLGDEDTPPLINVGCGQDLSIRELAELVAEVVGFEHRLVFDPTKSDGTPRKLLDVSRLSSLGWRPRTPLRQGLIATYRDYCEHQQVQAASL